MPKTKLSLPLARDTTFYTSPGQEKKRGALMHADCVENRLELGIVSALQVGQFAREVGVGQEHFAQADKGAHDGDVDLHGAGAAKQAGWHGHALLGEGVGEV